MTKTQCMIPIIKCIKELEDLRGCDEWTTCNKDQIHLLHLKDRGVDLDLINDYIKSIVSTDVNDINKFLEENGFGIKLSPSTTLAWSVAAIFDYLFKWRMGSARKEIVHTEEGGNTYHGFSLSYGFTVHNKSTVVIDTENDNFQIYIRMVDDAKEVVTDDYFMYAIGLQLGDILLDCEGNSADFNHVVVPNINYDEIVDISWLEGLKNSLDDIIGQAVQQTKFKMDHSGGHIQSAAAAQLISGSGAWLKQYKPFIINKPFILQLRKSEIPMPLFVGYFDFDSWVENDRK